MRGGTLLLVIAIAVLAVGISGGWYYTAVVYPGAQARECQAQGGDVTSASLAPLAGQPLYLLAEGTTMVGIILTALGGFWIGRGGPPQRGVTGVAAPRER